VSAPRRLRWGLPEPPRPKHPYRDTLLVYAGLAAVVVLVGWLTGGGIVKAVVVAVAVFAVASVYSVVRWHDLARRLGGRREERS
jgi:membrane protein implicated in regulation of membrane protease activity